MNIDVNLDELKKCLEPGEIRTLKNAQDLLNEKLLPADWAALRQAFLETYLFVGERHSPLLVEVYLAWRRLVDGTGVVVKTGPYDMIEVNITANPTFTSKIVRCIQAATDNYSMSVYPGEIFSTLETTDWEPIVRRVISIGGPAEKEIPLLDDESAVYTISRS